MTERCPRCGREWPLTVLQAGLTILELEGFFCGRGCPDCLGWDIQRREAMRAI